MSWDNSTYRTYAELLRQMNKFYKVLHKKKRFAVYLQEVGDGFEKTDDPDDELALKKIEDEQLALFGHELMLLVTEFFGPDVSGEKTNLLRYLHFPDQFEPLFVHVREIHDSYACSV